VSQETTHSNAEDLQTLKDITDAGNLQPVIDRTYPLAQVPDAMLPGKRSRAGEDRDQGSGVIATGEFAKPHPRIPLKDVHDRFVTRFPAPGPNSFA